VKFDDLVKCPHHDKPLIQSGSLGVVTLSTILGEARDIDDDPIHPWRLFEDVITALTITTR
jgi:hypothetical protein